MGLNERVQKVKKRFLQAKDGWNPTSAGAIRRQNAREELRIEKDYLRRVETCKPTPEVQFGIDLAKKIRQRVNESLDNPDTKEMPPLTVGETSHDVQYPVDVIAEEEVTKHFKEAWKQGINYGYVTEEQGLQLPPSGKAELIYVIDPVDGSRMIQSGAENGTITMVGVPGNIPNPTFSDIKFAVTAPVKDNHDVVFYTKQINDSVEVAYVSTHNTALLREMGDYSHFGYVSDFLIYESYSTSPQISGIILEDILSNNNTTKIKVEFPSGSYSLLQLITKHYGSYVDLRKRLIDDFPNLKIAVGDAPKAAMPLDIAAGWFMLTALGGKITDAYGNNLDNLPLWSLNENNQWTDTSQVSIIATRKPEHHNMLLSRVNQGISRVKRLERVFQGLDNETVSVPIALFPGMD